MWITRTLTPSFRQEYTVEHKILDSRSEHNLEIFKSREFNEVAVLDESEVFIQKYLFMESELLAHIPLCCIPNPSHVLLFDSFNLEIAHECLKHNIMLDCVQSDRKTLDSLMSFLPHFHEVNTHKNFSYYAQVMDLEIKKYQVAIADSILNKHQIDGLSRMLDKDGILIIKNFHPLFEKERFLEQLKNCSEFFSIVMPLFFHLNILNDKSYIFASKRFHPCADMLLQKIDLLPSLRFYNAKVHESVFTLPNFLFESLKDIARF